MTEADARARYVDIQKVIELTDKYTVSIFRMATFPPLYRNALLVGIVIGFSQGVITVFFQNFLCDLATNETTRSYCQKQMYDVSGGLLSMLLLYIVAVGPVLFYLYRLERTSAFYDGE